MDYIEAPDLYTVRSYDSWTSGRRLAHALSQASSAPRPGAASFEDRRGLPVRLPDERRAELIQAARRHIPLGASFSSSALRVHLVPTAEHVPPQSCYALNDWLSSYAEFYNLPAGTAGPQYCRRERIDFAAPGMWGVCDTLDLELIEAFLAEGYGEDADASAAVDARDDNLLALYRRYGVPLAPKRVIDGTRYIRPCRGGFEIAVPDGVVAISERAFGAGRMTMAQWGPDVPKSLFIGDLIGGEPVTFGSRDLRCKRLELPDSLRYIGPRAFEGMRIEDVVLPPSVEYVGPGAFFGAKRITVFNTVSPEARPADEVLDMFDGTPNAPIGWLGLRPRECTQLGIGEAEMADFEVIVRSAVSGEVLYRVYMPFGQMGDAKRNGAVKGRYLHLAATLASSWGRCASFAFAHLDQMHDRLPGQRAKLKTAINRLAYPVDLSAEARERYEAYVARNARRAVAIMAEDDEVDELRAVEHLVVGKRNRSSLLEVCAKARRMRSHLEGLAR